MKVNLIIGAGQLGSRHLQGLLKINSQQKIYVLDPSEDSLILAEKRSKEIQHCHQVIFTDSWDDIPEDVQVVIVSTGANVRYEILLKLIKKSKIDFLILEKVLFQSLDNYKEIDQLLKSNDIKCWVNHPRRMWNVYTKLKSELTLNRTEGIFQVFGSDWGLACNGLHFLDIISYISSSTITSLDIDWIDSEIHKSKRQGYIEFTGSIKGKLSNGSAFIISSIKGPSTPVSINISLPNSRWAILENNESFLIYMNHSNSYRPIITNFDIEYQSNLTTALVNSLINNGTCSLPTYQEASKTHILFIIALLEKYNTLLNKNESVCPIT